MREVFKAVSYALTEEVQHRDLRGENILISEKLAGFN